MSRVLRYDEVAGTLRFDGYFHDCPLPLHAVMYVDEVAIGDVSILKTAFGPSTASATHGGRESERMRIERIHAAAATSAPFEPIPEPEEPSVREQELCIEERQKLDAERKAAREDPDYDEADFMNVCFTPTYIVDIAFLVDKYRI